jgi:hypothetical protein
MIISTNLKYSKTIEEHSKCWKLHQIRHEKVHVSQFNHDKQSILFHDQLELWLLNVNRSLETTSNTQSSQCFKLSLSWGDNMHYTPHPNLSKWRYPLCLSASSMKIHHTI